MPDKKEAAKITHNLYHEDRVQSLAFQDEDGEDVSSGVVLPGEYDFGTAERTECITVTVGILFINEKEFYIGGPHCVIEKGTKIIIRARIPSAYICRYED